MPITICKCSMAREGTCMNLYPGHPHYGTCRCACHSDDHEPGLLDDIDGDLSEMVCDVPLCGQEAGYADEDGRYCLFHMTAAYGPPFESRCMHQDAVQWNEFNRVVQCHRCGVVFVPITAEPGPDYAAAVKAVYPEVRW